MGNRQVKPELEYQPITQKLLDNYPIYHCSIENSNFFLSNRTLFTPNFIFLRVNRPDIKLVDVIKYINEEKKILFTIDPIFEYLDIRLKLTISEYMTRCVELNLNIFDNNIPYLPVIEISIDNSPTK